jgi:hypothetical protein
MELPPLYEYLRWHESPFDHIEGPGSQDALCGLQPTTSWANDDEPVLPLAQIVAVSWSIVEPGQPGSSSAHGRVTPVTFRERTSLPRILVECHWRHGSMSRPVG